MSDEASGVEVLIFETRNDVDGPFVRFCAPQRDTEAVMVCIGQTSAFVSRAQIAMVAAVFPVGGKGGAANG